MNKKLNKTLRTITIVVLWLVLIVASLRAYNLYSYNKLHPQDRYEWNSWESPPEEFIIKREMMKAAKNMILIGILIAIIWEGLLYFDDPDKHFITYISNKIGPKLKKLGDKLEDDDEEEYE